MLFVALVLSTLSLAIALVLGAAYIELFDTLKQLREFAAFTDTLAPMDSHAAAGRQPSLLGLPLWADWAGRGGALFLSTRCKTCSAIAYDMQGLIPENLVIVLDAHGEQQAIEWIQRFDLDRDKVVSDHNGAIADRCGVGVTPSLLLIERGAIADGFIVPSHRQLLSALNGTNPRARSAGRNDAPGSRIDQ